MARAGAPPTWLLLAACLAVVVGIAALVGTEASAGFDRAVMQGIRATDLREPLAPLRVVTEAGSTVAIAILAVVAFVVGVLIGPWLHGVIAAAIIAVTSLTNTFIKLAVARDRPDPLEALITEPGYSFPSGHAALGMAGWGILAVLVWRTRLPRAVRIGLVAAFGALVVLIGLSRIYLGVHFPTDVVAGWAAGAVIVLVFERVTRTVSREPAAAAVDVDPAGPRSGRPAAG